MLLGLLSLWNSYNTKNPANTWKDIKGILNQVLVKAKQRLMNTYHYCVTV